MIGTKELILVVDDEFDLTATVSDLLKEEGFETLIANDGEAAEQIVLSRNDIDLVLCDISMPKVNGFEFFKSILMKKGFIPMVMITAHGESPKVVEALRLGAIDYFIKPFDHRVLKKQLPNWLEIARRAREKHSGGSRMEGMLRVQNAGTRK